MNESKFTVTSKGVQLAAVMLALLVMVLALPGVAWAAKRPPQPPLAVTKTVPTSGATEIAPTADIMAYFNNDMKASSITPTTFMIREQGTTTWLEATRSVDNSISPTSTDSSQSVVTLNPTADLTSNTTYEVLIVGGRLGVKDVKNKTLSSNVSWTFTTAADVTAPAPPSAIDLLTDTGANTNDDITSDTTPTFKVTAEPGSTVELFYEGASGLVSIGSGTTDATTGVANITVQAGNALADGTYTIVAKATDAAGNVSLVSNDASLQVKVESNIAVDATAPDITIDTKPAALTNNTSANFTYSSDEANSTFECKLDGGSFEACPAAGMSYSGLADSSHTFSVRATDQAGNTDADPATYGWTVDTIGPTASITEGPTDPSDSRSATFTFTGAPADGSYECKIDGEGSTGTYSACTSGQSFTVDADGTYTFYARASDALGNFGTPDSYTWTVDTPTTGDPVVTVTPTTLDLTITDVVFCSPKSKLLTVTNNGPGDVTFAAVDITGTDARYFSSGSQRYLANNGPFTVLDGNFFQDEVTFTAGPTAEERNSAKVYTATLTYKDSNGNTIGDPVTLTAQARCLNFG